MPYRFFSFVLITITLLLSGCAIETRPMAFSDDSDKTPIKEKSIYLITLNMKNSYKPSYQPRVFRVFVEKSGVTRSESEIFFDLDQTGKDETDSATAGNHYYLRLELAKGKYIIREFDSVAKLDWYTHFVTPLHADLEVKGPGIFYLGHIDAVVRSGNAGEFKAGPSLPVLAQAEGGASGGTFDIVVSDQWARDESAFLSRFPVLKGVAVQKTILPHFDRAKAQKWGAEKFGNN